MRLKQRTTLAEKKVTGKLEDIPHPTLDATIYVLVFGLTAIGGLVSYGAYQLFKPERQLAHKAKGHGSGASQRLIKSVNQKQAPSRLTILPLECLFCNHKWNIHHKITIY